MDLHRYTVINAPLVESLARQLGLPLDAEATTKARFGKFGAEVSSEKKRSPLPVNDPRLLPPIIAALRESGQLKAYRPDRASEFWQSDDRWYVHEATIATPVVLRLPESLPSGHELPKQITVWVLDPVDPRDEPQHDWDWVGSYVFVVEEMHEFPWTVASHLSGLSALRLTVEISRKEGLTVGDLYEAVAEDDVFGRWHDGHPIDKLRQAGGLVLHPRKVDLVYQIAYMTDEQSMPGESGPRRINDIMAYPLYIAE